MTSRQIGRCADETDDKHFVLSFQPFMFWKMFSFRTNVKILFDFIKDQRFNTVDMSADSSFL